MSRATASIQKLADRLAGSAWHNGVTLCMYDREIGKEIQIGAGKLAPRTPHFEPAITPLYVTAILLQLREEGKVEFDQPFIRYVSQCTHCAELHVKDGVDRTHLVTIRHLLSHMSGFGDFFLFKHQARTLHHDFAEGVDSSWGFDEVLQRTRSHGAVAEPGAGRRAHYTDSNFHLLGRVIESIEGQSFADVVKTRIADRLGLHSSYIYCDPSDRRPLDLMSRRNEVHVPRAMASLQADGGVVTTAREAVTFLRGFFEGYLFDKRVLPHLYTWRPVYFPVEAGVGLYQLRTPWWMSVPHRLSFNRKAFFRKVPRVVGNIGMAGSFALFAPDHGIYVAGSVNQFHAPARGVIFGLRALETQLFEIRPEHLSELSLGLSGQRAVQPPRRLPPDLKAASDRAVEFR